MVFWGNRSLQVFSGYADIVRVSPIQHGRFPRKRKGKVPCYNEDRLVLRTAKRSRHLEESRKQGLVLTAQPSETVPSNDILIPDFPVSRTGKEQACFSGRLTGKLGKEMGKLRTKPAI